MRLFQLLEEEKNGWEGALNNVFKLVDTLLDEFSGDAFIYFDDEDLIPYTLLGTAATYVVNNLGIPTLFIKKRNEVMVCEGRCTNSFNMVEAFVNSKDCLIQSAAMPKPPALPCNLKTIMLSSSNSMPSCAATRIISPEETNLVIDAVIKADALSNRMWNEAEILIPYGQENPEPVVLVKGCTLGQLEERFSIDNRSLSVPTGEV
ncbi:MAG: hypothetical protein MZV63_14975 [Marinilabiliales bacterium]|nr:hypothetical protein [Marinilabiliales bacterium]